MPQGSVLGPCLFDVFIDDLEIDLVLEDLESFLTKFADDTKLGREVSTDDDIRKLQRALDILCQWAENWGMAFNVKKCKVML